MRTKSTKENILKVSSALFARKGYSGCSIREISNKAKVNLGAINYHFGNKEKLYNEVFEYNYLVIKSEIEKLGKKAKNTEELIALVFNFFMSSESALLNTFKMLTSEEVASSSVDLDLNVEGEFGPPGQEVFYQKLSEDLEGRVPRDSLGWVVKMLFSSLVHFGLVLNTRLVKKKSKTIASLNPKYIEQALRNSVKSHIAYLKSNLELKT